MRLISKTMSLLSSFLKTIKTIAIAIVVVVTVVVIIPNIAIALSSSPKGRYIKGVQTIIVFGTSSSCVSDNTSPDYEVSCTPNTILKFRLEKVIEVYNRIATTSAEDDKIKKIIVTGDSKDPVYQETQAMQQYLIDNGVPENIIVQDQLGLRTMDSCMRAKTLYNINRAYLITNKSHLDRAMYLCNGVGIQSIGFYSNDPERKIGKLYNYVREFFANVSAFWEVSRIKLKTLIFLT